jgi:phosphohistidine phosphatase
MTLQLYLIRHGIAAERDSFNGPDAERPLIPKGRTKLIRLAKYLRTQDLSFTEMVTSPLLRAQETAELLQGLAKAKNPAKVADFLAPAGDFGAGLAWLQSWQAQGQNSPIDIRLAMVGHEPDLSQWAELLLWGEARGVLHLKKAGIIGLELPAAGELVEHCQLFWLTAPGLMGLGERT